jgi:hypothetical protein
MVKIHVEIKIFDTNIEPQTNANSRKFALTLDNFWFKPLISIYNQYSVWRLCGSLLGRI